MKETARERLFVPVQEQSGLEATARQPGPQREKKKAFNMGTGPQTSAHREGWTEKKERKTVKFGAQQCNKRSRGHIVLLESPV